MNHLGDRVLIVGIRSIGTALSAVVSATLASAGWRPMRITVRPSGPPFARVVELPDSVHGCARRALVVDEGPGISGSSMAAVAKALVEIGFEPEQISFLPGHGGEPGTAASDEVRGWWKRVRRYVTPWEQLRWSGMGLPECLREESREIAAQEQFTTVEDLSGGRWREKIYPKPANRPWAAISFERMKFLCTAKSDASILWKFVGLRKSVADKSSASLKEHSDHVWTPKLLGWFRGFVALPWVEGRPLSVEDAQNPEIIRHLGRYISAVSKAPLSDAQQATSFECLCEMLYWNTREALGGEMAEHALRFANKVRKPSICPAYGDGRLAPHEWRRTGDGQILKLDPSGHDMDHTMIGRQPVYWDTAGTMVEWGFSSSKLLLSALQGAGISLRTDVLDFYQMSYAAFRMGQASVCADACAADAEEFVRTRQAFENYREQLRELLKLTANLVHSHKPPLAHVH
ncbi:MAG TPA: hypothetical protein VG754_03595 [Verrucomicrobiae bacterium]|nr:hypothetical protein [Verrucomicrobiae bacterium]